MHTPHHANKHLRCCSLTRTWEGGTPIFAATPASSMCAKVEGEALVASWAADRVRVNVRAKDRLRVGIRFEGGRPWWPAGLRLGLG